MYDHLQMMPAQGHHLGWHETLELHELTAFQANVLMKCKLSVRKIQCQVLRGIYLETIQILEQNLKELLQFFPLAPRDYSMVQQGGDAAFYAGDLLGAAKASVRNYAVAITETATPALREVLTKQLLGAIQLHAKIYYYMYERGYYPSYDLEKLLLNDINNVQKAIGMNY